ncbi:MULTISPECIES: MerR family transcriptional regulator [Micromonospora]|uniref:MerR family transcriptional regulator n=1 Tax=Micromonospora solifontis TaxID=2487138 RepID=A0ABX9WDC4_9ACTN|nr:MULTISPECIES: MerR family transcriptional regulator [Micromonospora]NES14512.1 MerR family transcriptional regulator [Micromonospora sp. PPF5-17B]NES38664.1 MerR family transcriptional regulator [Micromonospora solifontis]NES56442.1 MerR family transcriptional regulator [Micromonospora sp. PPF5-6]RNL94048.1 MerR family transcriptional regulator [Micromonospora solifontis]
MELLTIGAFARAARLTPKALRLYDELGLLAPAAVDPHSGYRYYEPAQLDRARLIAALRRAGMPLAEIHTVCRLSAEAAAEAVDAWWRRVSADTAARRRVVALLVDQLSERSAPMSEPTFRYAVRCTAGAVRDSNEDAAYAGDRLLAVADGLRGPGGAAASAAAIDALRPLELTDAPAAELLATLADAVTAADRTVRAHATDGHQPATTLTAVLRRGTRLALVHVGDTRAYLLRGGELSRLTQDHTYVQSQVDQGRLTPAEAAAHPQRALLSRALGAGAPVEADLALRTALVGDRYLLCSDGLSAVVGPAALQAALAGADDPESAVGRLVDLAYAEGAPDNIACVVADVVAG